MMGGEDMGNMMGMMSKMMEGCSPEMMMEMMPECFGMMLTNIPKEKRMDFVLKMINTLVKQICEGMTQEEKKDFIAKIVEKIKA